MNGKLVLAGIIGMSFGLLIMCSGNLQDFLLGLVLSGLGISAFNAGFV